MSSGVAALCTAVLCWRSRSRERQKVLKPYCGHDTRQRPNAKRQWFGDSPELYSRYISSYAQQDADPKYQTNDDWSYYFNSLGYRGEEFNSYAPETIFVYGCSHTFGL